MWRADTCSAGLACQWLTSIQTTATASTTCNIMNGKPPYNINITTAYESFPNEFDAFIQLDSWNQASIWWGAMLLSIWFQGIRAQMAHMQDPQSTFHWGDVTINFDLTANIKDIDFISYVGSFGMSNGTVHWLSSDDDHLKLDPLRIGIIVRPNHIFHSRSMDLPRLFTQWWCLIWGRRTGPTFWQTQTRFSTI